MQKLKVICRLILIINLVSFAHSRNIELESIFVESKINGIIVTMKLDSALSENDISAWQAKSGWFYMTLYKVTGDTTKLKKVTLPNEVLDFQLTQSKESFQLGIRLNNPIDNYEFSKIKENSIMATLHYSTEYLSNLSSIKPLEKKNKRKGLNNGMKKWLYLTGIGVSLAGTLNNDNISLSSQTQIGLAILLTTYIIDKIWRI